MLTTNSRRFLKRNHPELSRCYESLVVQMNRKSRRLRHVFKSDETVPNNTTHVSIDQCLSWIDQIETNMKQRIVELEIEIQTAQHKLR